jgi:hypothetical protein
MFYSSMIPQSFPSTLGSLFTYTVLTRAQKHVCKSKYIPHDLLNVLFCNSSDTDRVRMRSPISPTIEECFVTILMLSVAT